MSFGPRSQPAGLLRTLLFWILMIVLATVLWRTAQTSSGPVAAAISYSDFMGQLEKNNILSARFVLAQSTADVSGVLRIPSGQKYDSRAPRDSVTALSDTLRKNGATVSFAEARDGNWTSFMATFGPIILLSDFGFSW